MFACTLPNAGYARAIMRRLTLFAPLILLSACVTTPPPAPPPPVQPAPPPPAPVAVLPPDWRDWPVTPGGWRYQPGLTGSASLFGVAGQTVAFTIRCDRGQRAILLGVGGAVAAGATMAITTTEDSASYPVQPIANGGAARLSATDPFLDKMAFSRGRFLVTVTGLPKLVIPSWPEFARVVEDCRG